LEKEDIVLEVCGKNLTLKKGMDIAETFKNFVNKLMLEKFYEKVQNWMMTFSTRIIT